MDTTLQSTNSNGSDCEVVPLNYEHFFAGKALKQHFNYVNWSEMDAD